MQTYADVCRHMQTYRERAAAVVSELTHSKWKGLLSTHTTLEAGGGFYVWAQLGDRIRCAHVCIRLHATACVYIRLHTSAYACMYVCMYVYTALCHSLSLSLSLCLSPSLARYICICRWDAKEVDECARRMFGVGIKEGGVFACPPPAPLQSVTPPTPTPTRPQPPVNVCPPLALNECMSYHCLTFCPSLALN